MLDFEQHPATYTERHPMSENTATENVTTDETPVFTPPDTLSALVLAQINEQAAEYNTGRKRLDASSGDLTPLLADLFLTDESVAKIRKAVEDLDNKREALISEAYGILRKDLESSQMNDEDKAALDTTLKSLKAEIKAGIDFAKRKYPGIETAVTPLVGSRVGGKSGGTAATGGRKPRVSTIYVDGVPATETVKEGTPDEKVVSTFTIAAKRMGGVKVPDIHAAYFAAAGTDDVDAAPESVEFVMTVGDKNFTVRVDK